MRRLDEIIVKYILLYKLEGHIMRQYYLILHCHYFKKHMINTRVQIIYGIIYNVYI